MIETPGALGKLFSIFSSKVYNRWNLLDQRTRDRGYWYYLDTQRLTASTHLSLQGGSKK